jgi:hypothetical protein
MIKLGYYYLTKTLTDDHYSGFIVQPTKEKQKGEYLCFVINAKDLTTFERMNMPFYDYELIELSPVIKELYV